MYNQMFVPVLSLYVQLLYGFQQRGIETEHVHTQSLEILRQSLIAFGPSIFQWTACVHVPPVQSLSNLRRGPVVIWILKSKSCVKSGASQYRLGLESKNLFFAFLNLLDRK